MGSMLGAAKRRSTAHSWRVDNTVTSMSHLEVHACFWNFSRTELTMYDGCTGVWRMCTAAASFRCLPAYGLLRENSSYEPWGISARAIIHASSPVRHTTYIDPLKFGNVQIPMEDENKREAPKRTCCQIYSPESQSIDRGKYEWKY
jgi:hypothetical protein